MPEHPQLRRRRQRLLSLYCDDETLDDLHDIDPTEKTNKDPYKHMSDCQQIRDCLSQMEINKMNMYDKKDPPLQQDSNDDEPFPSPLEDKHPCVFFEYADDQNCYDIKKIVNTHVSTYKRLLELGVVMPEDKNRWPFIMRFIDHRATARAWDSDIFVKSIRLNGKNSKTGFPFIITERWYPREHVETILDPFIFQAIEREKENNDLFESDKIGKDALVSSMAKQTLVGQSFIFN